MQAANPTLGDLEVALGALQNQALDLAEAVGTRTDLPPAVQDAIDDVVVSLSRAYEIVQDADNGLVDETDDLP
jgi:hypothetical protein